MKILLTLFLLTYPFAIYANGDLPVVNLTTKLFDPPLQLPHYVDFAEQRMKKRFGNAQSKNTISIKGHEPGEIIYRTNWIYPEFTISTLKSSFDLKNSWFDQVEITDSSTQKLQYNISVGMDKGNVIKILGNPAHATNSLLVYGVNTDKQVGLFRASFNASVVFNINNTNRVSKITWKIGESD